MNRRLAFSLLLIAVFAAMVVSSSEPAPDRWESIGPYGGPLAAIEFHPALSNVAFASGYDSFQGSFYRTTDGGKSWLRMSPRGRCTVRAHPRLTNYVLAVCSGSFYLSVDLGNTWLYQSRPPSGNHFDVEFDPINPSLIYLALDHQDSREGAFYRSNDSGRTWKTFMKGAIENLVQGEIEIDPFDPRHFYLLARDGLFVSTNSGATWSHQQSNINPGSQDNIPILKAGSVHSGTLYLLQESSLVKTTDGGRAWSVIRNPSIRAHSLSVAGDRVIYGDEREASQSDDGGHSWSQITLPQTWPLTTLDFAAADPHHSKRILVSVPIIGLIQSENGGRSWQKLTHDFTEFSSQFVEIADTQPMRILTPAETRWDHLAVTTTMGASWRLFQNMRYDYALTIYPRNPLIWAADSDLGLAITRNAGRTWEFHSLLNEENAYDLEFDSFDPSTIFAATNIGVQRTTDSGANWTLVTTMSDSQNPMVLEADPARKGYVFTATRDGRLFRTSDGGSKWEQVSATSCGNNDIEDIQVNPYDSNDVLYTTTRVDVNVICNHIFRSSDGGSSWRAIDMPATYGGFYKIYFDPAQRDLLFLLPEYGGLYTSYDGGSTWSLYNLKGARRITRIAFSVTHPEILAGAGPDGVFLFHRSSPSGMTLDQMVPNPAHAGSVVTLHGRGFGSAGQLFLGPNRMTIQFWNDTEIRFALPQNARTASIKITKGDESVSQELLVIGGSPVYPNAGPGSGGTRIVITLHRVYDSQATVLFGNKVATINQNASLNFEYTREGTTLMIATSPPGNGTVNVYVKDVFGVNKAGRFTYTN